MNVDESNSNQIVLKQLRAALGGISQENLARLIGCSIRKIQRGENGTETTWTTEEAQNLDKLLEDNFGVDINSLPRRLSSTEPVPFLQEAISQKNQG